MFPVDGTAYFYGPASPLYCLIHPQSYVVKVHKSRACGLCLMKEQFETELPTKIHLARVIAENGNPQMDGQFVGFLETSLGLMAPKPDQTLKEFRRARKQYKLAEPNRKRSPMTRALWDMFGTQPKLAGPLLLALLGASEAEIARRRDMSLYNVRVTIGKAINMAAEYIR